MLHAQLPTPADVKSKRHETTAPDGSVVGLSWYTKNDSDAESAVLYTHGGGMILSNVGIYDGPVSRYVSATGVPFLSVEYRYAPEFPAPIPVTDCYAGLEWLAANSAKLSVEPNRIAIMGDSGGSGVAASLAIYSRDRSGPPIAKQILIYPMLDDRNITPDPELVDFATWNYDDNATGWGALLGESRGSADVSSYAAAARLTEFAGLSRRIRSRGAGHLSGREHRLRTTLVAAGVSTELHVHRAVPHPFDALAPIRKSHNARALIAVAWRKACDTERPQPTASEAARRPLLSSSRSPAHAHPGRTRPLS